MELIIVYILLVQSLCAVLSSTQNSKSMDKVENLEKAIFKETPCLNCTLEVKIEYLELFVKKFLTMDSVDQSVNWSNNFAFGLASAITSFGFNLVVAVLGLCYTNQINRKFKEWEESEELRFLQKLERMQFPPTANYEMAILPERWLVHLFY